MPSRRDLPGFRNLKRFSRMVSGSSGSGARTPPDNRHGHLKRFRSAWPGFSSLAVKADFSSAAPPAIARILAGAKLPQGGTGGRGRYSGNGDQPRRHERWPRRAVKPGFPAQNGGTPGGDGKHGLTACRPWKAAADIGGLTKAAAPIETRRLKERRDKATGRGRRRKGAKRADARATRAPAARREQKTALFDAPGRYSGPVHFGRDPNGEGPETRCNNDGFCFRR